jgi:mannitol/fructose-specific phosphotransferase system IIA component (Ntr-type)
MNGNNTPRFIVSSLLSPATIELRLRGNQQDDILQELVDRIPPSTLDPTAKQTLFHALQEREMLCSTGVGDGVALPHARNALVGLVEHPVIVFGRHPSGIAFGALDGIPAQLFFLLVAPTVSQHLQVLARLSRMVRDPRLRQDLLAADRPEKVVSLIREVEANW